MAAVALQHPDLAADQLDDAVRKLGMQGAAIGAPPAFSYTPSRFNVFN
jgi:hypothetical protein